MKTIKCYNNPERLLIVDNKNYKRCLDYNWTCSDSKRTVSTSYNGRLINIGRFILGPDDNFDMFPDHIDRNHLNNLESNLRWANQSQNTRNSPKLKNTTSQFRGVYFHKKSNKWNALIQLNKHKINLGYYFKETTAAYAYNIAANILGDGIANLNDVVIIESELENLVQVKILKIVSDWITTH